jgi:NADPH:quinone reductase
LPTNAGLFNLIGIAMRAAYITQTGSVDVIQVGELPEPPVGANDVLIRVEAVAVNPIDTYVRSGAVAMPIPKPYILGCDAAGTVEQVGSAVTGLRAGDRVWTTNQGLLGRQGTFAEKIAVDAQWVYPMADGVAATAAAACGLVGVTAHLGLFRDARLRAGQTLFVRGGTGGVGAMVVQMGKIAGATVITTAGTPDKAQLARQLGADFVIQHASEDVATKLKEYAPEGVHLFWETLRQPDFDFATSAMAERGTMVLMAGRDARPPFPVGPFYVKSCSLVGFAMFKATSEELRQSADDIVQWMSQGKLRPLIARTMPLDAAAQAHQLQESNTLQMAGTIAGKIVLTIA